LVRFHTIRRVGELASARPFGCLPSECQCRERETDIPQRDVAGGDQYSV
jgi:hypothetical protein